jgi:chemotaxis signal transduction protein
MDPFNHHHGTSAVLSMPTATHCVFRRGSFWLALPAIAVREAMPRQNMVFVPGTPNLFVGLCHVRSEFIPVLNLNSVLPDCDDSDGNIMLVVDDTDGPWALLVDEVTSLRALEISDAPVADVLDTSCVIVGWATHGSDVIQVLDQTRVRMLAEQELAAMWQSENLLRPRFTNMKT